MALTIEIHVATLQLLKVFEWSGGSVELQNGMIADLCRACGATSRTLSSNGFVEPGSYAKGYALRTLIALYEDMLNGTE